MFKDTDLNPPFENLYENVCINDCNNVDRLTLLNNLKRHIKREYINIKYYKEYFNTIFFILNNKKFSSIECLNCCYSTLCYLVKRLSMQQQDLLIYNETNGSLIKKSLDLLFVKSTSDNNTKKAILSIYLLQSDSFNQILLNLMYQTNIIDFILNDILKLYSGNEELTKREFKKYEILFDKYMKKDSNAKIIINKKAKELDIELQENQSISGKKQEPSLFIIKKGNQLEAFLFSIKPERELQLQPIDDFQRQFNNIDTFHKQLILSFPQSIFDCKETETNWQKRQQYLTKLIHLYKIYNSKSKINEQHIINSIVCIKSLRTSVATTAINFMTLIFSTYNINDGSGLEITETIYLRIMTELHRLLQTGKKILFYHIHYLFTLLIQSYLKTKHSIARLGKLLYNITLDKNVMAVKCCCDYITLFILYSDNHFLQHAGSLQGIAFGYGSRSGSPPPLPQSSMMIGQKNDLPWIINLFKLLNGSQFAEVRLRIRQNFWNWIELDKQQLLLSFLDDMEARKLAVGYEREWISVTKSMHGLINNNSNINNNNSIIKTGIKRERDDNNNNNNNNIVVDDLEAYGELEIPNLEMTMIPYKKQKKSNQLEIENTAESRISSGETFAEMEAIEELEIELKGLKNGLTRIDNFDNTGVIGQINNYFSKNKYCINETVIQLERMIVDSIAKDDIFLSTFLNTSVDINFKLGVLLKLDKENQNLHTYLNSIRDTIFNENEFTSVLIYIKCCQKFELELIPMNDVEKEIILRFG